MHPHVDTHRLLVDSLGWLERKCAASARSRPELEAEDLFQEVVQRYLERAPDWFSGEASRESDLARARSLLTFLVMQRLKSADRERQRRGSPPRREGEEDLGLDIFPAEGVDLDQALAGEQAARATDALDNPTYRLALRAVFREHVVEEPEFHAAERAFRRPVPEAWPLFDQERRASTHQAWHWRLVVAEIVRCVEAYGASSPTALKSAREWLDKTVQRARAAVLAALATGEAAP